MTHKCTIQEQPAQPALVIKAHTPVQEMSTTLGRIYGTILQQMGAAQVAPAGPPYVAYFNMDMENLEIEAGLPVAQPVSGDGEVLAVTIPGGQAAVCEYIGPYDGIAAAYEALTQFVAQQGGEPSGVSYEFYLNDPTENAPEDLQTRIMFPLK